MVETPKLSSLAGELLKFFFLSSILLGVLLSFAFFFLGQMNAYYALGTGFAISAGWVLFNILWTKNKLEELFGRLLYVIEILEERQKEKTVVPIPLHEEVMDIVHSIRELVKGFEEKYEREVRSLEEQIETISENASRLLTALDKAQEGEIDVEFPSGLDPIGAIGQAVEQTIEEYRNRLLSIGEKVELCKDELERIHALIEENGDKIDVQRVKEGIDRLMKLEKEIEKELSFIKKA